MKSKKDHLAIFGTIMLLTSVFLSCSSSKRSAVPCPEFSKYKSDYEAADHKKNKKLQASHYDYIKVKNRTTAFAKKTQSNRTTVIGTNPSGPNTQHSDFSFHFNKTALTDGLIASADNSILPLVEFSSDNKLVKSAEQKALTGILPQTCDTILLKSGVTLMGKVEEIKQKEITYRKCNNLTGPLISILKSDVIRIDYSNGTHDVLAATVIDNDDIYSHDKDVFVKENPPIVKTEGLGVAGFVSSVVGLFVAGVILGTVGIIFGSISLRNIKRNPERLKGRGLAIAAIIIGVIAVIGALIVISAV